MEAKNGLQKTDAKKSAIARRGSMFDASNILIRKIGSSVCTFAEDPSSEIFATKGPTMKFQNSYKMEPDERFEVGKVEALAEEILSDHLGDIQYSLGDCRYQCKEISEDIKLRVKALGYARHKIVVFVNIGQLKDQGVKVGSRCLWDAKRDSWAGASYVNSSLWATATVYAVYYE